jgi:membrane fusion protein (multidrug efflux system)
MRLPRKRILFPVAGTLVLALTAFLLVQFGAVDLPWGSARAEEGSASKDAKKKDKKDKDEKEEVPVPVELAKAERRPLAAYYRASSVLEADRHVELVSKVQGRVEKILVEEGDWVKQGQVLVELENDRERVQLRQAELKMDEQARDLERRKALLEKNLITQEDYDLAEGRHQLAETERDLAKIVVSETIVRAPFAGQVTDRRVVPGQHVAPAENLLTLVDFDPLRVRVHLPETIARRVSPGDQVLVSVDALADPLPATVERIAPVVDPQTSTVRLTLLMKGQNHEALVGGFVKVRITTDTKTEALSIPKVALVEEGGLRSVFVASADSVRKVELRTGLSDEASVEVLEGVAEGDLVVTLGQGGLRSGSKIDVLNAKEVGWVKPPPDSTQLASADKDKKKKKSHKKDGK